MRHPVPPMYSEESVAMPPREVEPLKKGLGRGTYIIIIVVIVLLALLLFGSIVIF
ncbi:MAG: hypothetical protein JSV43_08820 [Methanobacteriota archaeon]|nr:MAG: hypothetical protein JSV43_08820 [Euryarchaeota archaeon]